MSRPSLFETDSFLTAAVGIVLDGTPGDDELKGTADDDVIDGLAGNDKLAGQTGNDTLVGGDGDDLLYGGRGDDILDGGAGNDYLSGSKGNDTYVFAAGGGQDRIQNFATDGGVDRIVLGAGISADDIILRAEGDSLVLMVKGTDDRLTVASHFLSDSYAMDYLEFADGTIWNKDDMAAALQVTEGADTLFGTSGDDVIDSLGGDDFIYGNAGNDTLEGGTGNDRLNGGLGSDTYSFGIGGGQDRIDNYDAGGGTDRIVLGAGITTDDVTLRAEDFHLVLSINGTSDSITVNYHFYSNQYALEGIVFADGTVWNADDIVSNLAGPTEGADTLFGTSGDDVINSLGGDDAIYGNAGNDTLAGGTGDDKLYGSSGNDTLSGGSGRDSLSGDTGDDVLAGGAGDDDLGGGFGADTYLFGLGGGQDRINNFDADGGADRIVLGAGITVDDVSLKAHQRDLILSINGTEDSLFVEDHFLRKAYAIDYIEFADGTVWDRNDILAHMPGMTEGNDTWHGTAGDNAIDGLGGDDQLYGHKGNDDLAGGAGDDDLFGGKGSDTLAGGEGDDYFQGADDSDLLLGQGGNDRLYGNGGNDTLDGGSGNDILYGGSGSDTYLFGLGSGHDSVSNYIGGGDRIGANAGDTERIVLGVGIEADDVIMSRERNDLVLKIIGTDDELRVGSHYYSSYYAVDSIELADGTQLDIPHLSAIGTRQHADMAESIFG